MIERVLVALFGLVGLAGWVVSRRSVRLDDLQPNSPHERRRRRGDE